MLPFSRWCSRTSCEDSCLILVVSNILPANARGVLLATDVAARGLDIPDVQHVIHYQVPKTTEAGFSSKLAFSFHFMRMCVAAHRSADTYKVKKS